MLNLLYAIFMGAWRDSFGKDGWGLPIYHNRMVQHIVAFLGTSALCYFVKDITWYWTLWIAVWMQIEWALGHGPCFDVGKGGKPDKKMIERYEKMVGCKLLYKIFPEDEWYGMGFDFILLAIRYTYPILPIIFLVNPAFIFVGLVVSSLYLIYRYCPFFQKHRLLDVEIWAGFSVGLLLACCL